MARYKIHREDITPYGVLGPRLDYLLKYTTDSGYPLEEQNKIIFGLSGGAGVEFNMSNRGIFVEVQYQPDLSPVTSKEPLDVRNHILLFTLGIRYLNTR